MHFLPHNSASLSALKGRKLLSSNRNRETVQWLKFKLFSHHSPDSSELEKLIITQLLFSSGKTSVVFSGVEVSRLRKSVNASFPDVIPGFFPRAIQIVYFCPPFPIFRRFGGHCFGKQFSIKQIYTGLLTAEHIGFLSLFLHEQLSTLEKDVP